MASKFKKMFKRQWSQPARVTSEILDNRGEVLGELHAIPEDFVRRNNRPASAIIEDSTTDSSENSRKTQIIRRRHRFFSTSLGPIEDILQCPICLQRMKSPRMLPCQHTFCHQCLKNQLMTSSSTSGNALKCPVCNLTVTDQSPDELPTNIYVQTLLQVIENSKSNENGKKDATVTFASSTSAKDSDNDPANSGLPKCSVCNATENICESRCKHCNKFFCGSCWKTHVESLTRKLANLNEQLTTTEDRFAHKLKDFVNKVQEMKEFIDKDIEQRIAELRQEREDRMNRVNEMAAKGKSSAEEVKGKLRKVQNELEERCNQRQETLVDDQERVRIIENLLNKTEELVSTVAAWEPELEEVEIGFGNGRDRLELTKLKEDARLFYKRKDFVPSIVVNRDLVQRPSGMAYDPWRNHIFVACSGSGQVVIFDRKFKPLRRIYHQDMMAPQGVAFLEDKEEIIVTDKWKHCIFAFNRKGELVRRICSKGQGELQLRCPEGIAVYQDFIYVADTGNDRIQILRKDGSFYGIIGPTDKNGSSVTKSGKTMHVVVNHLNQPTDVAVTATKIVVADCGNHKIKIFNHEGEIIHMIGGAGSSRDLFKSPEVVKIDKKENVIVGDSGNGRIQIFSSDGEFLRMLGGRGGKNRQFGWISGLLVKNTLDILVADSKNNVVIQL